MAYKTWIPVIINGFFKKEETLSELRRAGASGIMLALFRPLSRRIVPDYYEGRLDELIRYFTDNGIECGVWVGESVGHWCNSVKPFDYRPYVDMCGQTYNGGFCPADEKLQSDLCDYFTSIVKSGARLILIDDDFRMSNHGSGLPGCACPYHMAQLEKAVGEKLTVHDAVRQVFSGKPNPVRSAWLKVQGQTLYDLAAALRKAVDAVDDTVRIGLCTNGYITDYDGTDLVTLVKTLAGKTKPFMRGCGAPYWAGLFGLGAVANYERFIARLASENGIENISEADAFPRPRLYCPAIFIERFEEIILADGHTDGILDYILDYYSSPRSETGYVDVRADNAKTRAFIEKEFSARQAVGVRVFAALHTLENADFGECDPVSVGRHTGELPQVLHFASDMSLPVTTDMTQSGAVLVFGEHTKYLHDFSGGVITDIAGAKLLTERGIDVGLKAVGRLPDESLYDYACVYEHDLVTDETASVGMLGLFDISVRDGARVISEFISENKRSVGAYAYENQNGERFLVLPFDYEKSASDNTALVKSYLREDQIKRELTYLARRAPDALSRHDPYVYMLTKKDADTLAVGIWNLYPDTVRRPVITLSDEYAAYRTEYYHCTGTRDGNTVTLSPIEGYGFAAILLRR